MHLSPTSNGLLDKLDAATHTDFARTAAERGVQCFITLAEVSPELFAPHSRDIFAPSPEITQSTALDPSLRRLAFELTIMMAETEDLTNAGELQTLQSTKLATTPLLPLFPPGGLPEVQSQGAPPNAGPAQPVTPVLPLFPLPRRIARGAQPGGFFQRGSSPTGGPGCPQKP